MVGRRGAAAALGPPIGGLLVQASWRWVFLVNLPFALLALVLGVRTLDEVRDPDAQKSDLVGAALLTVAVASLVAAIVQGSDWGWTSGRILGAFGVALVGRRRAGAALPAPSQPDHRTGGDPPLRRGPGRPQLARLLRRLRALVLGGVLLLTGLWHESVLAAGFMIAPGPLLAGITAFPGGLLGARFGHRAVGTVGALLFAASGVWWITHVGVTPDWAGAYLPGSLLSGIGVGLMLPSLGGAATAPLPPERFATGSALYVMSRQIGIALGVAGLVAILGVSTGEGAVHAFHHAWIFMIACALVAGALYRGSATRSPKWPTPLSRQSRTTRRSTRRPCRRPPALPAGGGQVARVRHQQLVPRRRGERRSDRFPLVVERARPQRRGQRGVVVEAEPGQAGRVGGGEGRTEQELALGDPQGVARHAGLEAGAVPAALQERIEVFAHRFDELGRGRPAEGRRRSAAGTGPAVDGGGVPKRAKRSHSLSQTRRPMAANSTERVAPLRCAEACRAQMVAHFTVA